LRLAVNLREHRLVQPEWRLQQAAKLRRLREARELQEELVHVLPDLVGAGEEAIVRVAARGARMVVARAEMAVATNAARLSPHDEDELGVRLVADHPVHHVRAGFLQAVGQLDVRFLVETRAQLDDDCHILAGVGGCHERIDYRRFVARAVERLLDREHLGVGCGLPHEIHHGRETLERVMQQHVVLADHREEVR
jgi:hypothetical protein